MSAQAYDPSIIGEFAVGLYKQADRMMISWGIRLALAGGVIGFLAGAIPTRTLDGGAIPGVLVALLGAMLGGAYGREKAFELRLRAQEALCLLQTEINTRPIKPS